MAQTGAFWGEKVSNVNIHARMPGVAHSVVPGSCFWSLCNEHWTIFLSGYSINISQFPPNILYSLYNDACLLCMNLFFWMQVSIGFSAYSWCLWSPQDLVYTVGAFGLMISWWRIEGLIHLLFWNMQTGSPNDSVQVWSLSHKTEVMPRLPDFQALGFLWASQSTTLFLKSTPQNWLLCVTPHFCAHTGLN